MVRISKLTWSFALIIGLSSFVWAQPVDKTLQLSYSSPMVVQQGEVTVTLSDFIAYLDWRVPKEEQRTVLASPSRIEGLLEALVLSSGFLNRIQATAVFSDPIIQARVYQAAAREARAIYREQLQEELELDSYESQARELYMVDQDRFITRESIDFEHILIAVSEDIDAVALMRRAIDAYEALSELPFDEVAQSYSDDPGFEEHRGKFEGIPIDSLVPPVAEAARNLEIGEFSAPVQSPFGWHIFRITRVHESQQMTWEEARPIAEEIARERHLTRAFERRLRELNSAPMQFADGAVKMILDHYGISGFEMPIPEPHDEAGSK